MQYLYGFRKSLGPPPGEQQIRSRFGGGSLSAEYVLSPLAFRNKWRELDRDNATQRLRKARYFLLAEDKLWRDGCGEERAYAYGASWNKLVNSHVV